ncbi:hypothetical protein AXF42_Ash021253 [Apostasia shenzhenica]|uniref:Uncharacterized protein n=1 Tax=Apostasia shenzhenica TaxID=1088818 RepID=A0A2I0BCS6_9ASPA|nr:hypothetical protein AXF42_Ash021253 [Apostasia shenzhenica]
MAQPEVGSSGWKSAAHRAASGVPPTARENPNGRVPPIPGRTHNRIRSPRGTTSSRWSNVGKGSQQNGSVTSGKGLALRVGHGGPSFEPNDCWERSPWGTFPGVEQPTQNLYGQRESDCLIKTKHCDGPKGCSRNVISAKCSECESEEVQPSAGLGPFFWIHVPLRQDNPGGRHCQVGSLAGAAHLLKDNAAHSRSRFVPPKLWFCRTNDRAAGVQGSNASRDGAVMCVRVGNVAGRKAPSANCCKDCISWEDLREERSPGPPNLSALRKCGALIEERYGVVGAICQRFTWRSGPPGLHPAGCAIGYLMVPPNKCEVIAGLLRLQATARE